MTLDACAGIVERGDPDRWRAVLAAPVEARRVMLPIYAFNLEVARAPWLTQEALIAEMRLQWWADVLGEIADGVAVRRHEVATPLSEVVSPAGAKALQDVVEARRRDVHREVFAAADDAHAYVCATAGALAGAVALELGATEEHLAPIASIASGGGLARLLQATPELERRGWRLWRDVSQEDRVALASGMRAQLQRARKELKSVPRNPSSALLPDWSADALLSRFASAPDEPPAISPLKDRMLLLRAAVTGRV